MTVMRPGNPSSLRAETTPSVLTALGWKYLASAGVAVCQILIAAILSRGLGPEQFGRWAFIQALLTFGLLAADCGTSTSLVKFAADSRESRQWLGSFLRFRIVSAIFAGAGVALVLVSTSQTPSLRNLGYLALILACAGKSLGLAAMPPLQVEHRWRIEGLVSLIGPVLWGVGVFCLAQFGTLSLGVVLAAMASAYLLQAVLGWVMVGVDLAKPSTSPRPLITFGLPIALNSAAYLLLVWLDKLFVVSLLGDKALGIFYAASALLTFFRAAAQPAETINQRWLLSHVRGQRGPHEFFWRSSLCFLFIGLFLTVVIFVFANEFVQLLNGSAYRSAALVAQVLALGLLVRIASIPLSQYLIHAEENPKAVLRAQCSGIAVNVLLAYPAIESLGLIGAAYSTAFAFLVTTFAYLVQVRDRAAKRTYCTVFLALLGIEGVLLYLGLEQG